MKYFSSLCNFQQWLTDLTFLFLHLATRELHTCLLLLHIWGWWTWKTYLPHQTGNMHVGGSKEQRERKKKSGFCYNMHFNCYCTRVLAECLAFTAPWRHFHPLPLCGNVTIKTLQPEDRKKKKKKNASTAKREMFCFKLQKKCNAFTSNTDEWMHELKGACFDICYLHFYYTVCRKTRAANENVNNQSVCGKYSTNHVIPGDTV